MSSSALTHILGPWLIFLGLLTLFLGACVWAAVIDGRRARREWYPDQPPRTAPAEEH